MAIFLFQLFTFFYITCGAQFYDNLKLNGQRFGYDTRESTWKATWKATWLATWLAMWKAMWPPCGCHVNRLPLGSSASNSAARGA